MLNLFFDHVPGKRFDDNEMIKSLSIPLRTSTQQEPIDEHFARNKFNTKEKIYSPGAGGPKQEQKARELLESETFLPYKDLLKSSRGFVH